jgi:chloramphenicol 3-O-phosphotransferase
VERSIYLVSGIPGAGKTTVSRLLAKRFERGVHIESDELQKQIVTGGVWPDGQPSGENRVWGTPEEGLLQLRLRCRNACLLADSFFEAGFTPVIDDVIIGARLQHFRDDLHGRPLMFVLLTPAQDVVSKRDATRPDKHVFHKWGYLDEAMRNETPPVGLWLDTSRMTANEVVDEIVRRIDEARIN